MCFLDFADKPFRISLLGEAASPIHLNRNRLRQNTPGEGGGGVPGFQPDDKGFEYLLSRIIF